MLRSSTNIVLACGALGVALVSQYGFDLFPCHLCILQRWPYVAVMALGLLGLAFTAKGKIRLVDATLVGSLLAYLTTGGLALYHVAVENHWVDGPSGCTSQDLSGLSEEQLLAQIMNAPVVLCDEVSIEFLGISMAGWNAIYALFCLAVCWKLLKRGKLLHLEGDAA
jgi:disulfide bond formation protein DsbB